jgi:hypothetical protein
MFPVVVFLRTMPFCGLLGRCAVDPVGSCNAPVPPACVISVKFEVMIPAMLGIAFNTELT